MLNPFPMTSIPPRPQNRNDFRTAIICALPFEARMVTAVFDKNWKAEGVAFDQPENDHNTYTLGVIGKHNVVLVHMPGMGSTAGATAAANLRWTFPSIDIAFVVGVCGAIPEHITTKQEICLGDCIVSTALIQYGFGRQYPGHFSRKSNVEDVLGKAVTVTGSLLAKLQATEDLRGELAQHLQVLQDKEARACYPGAQKDRLYDSTYLHTHRDTARRCDQCVKGSVVCTKNCGEIGCDGAQPRASLILYENAQKEYLPKVHFGRYGSADTVLKSGTDRDEHVKVDKIIAFEMEAAGIWDNLPTLVVKSACDYADSHKDKEWQDYAAATAAAALKAILEYWRVVDVLHGSDQAVQVSNTSLSNRGYVYEADELVRNFYRTGDRLRIERLSGQELELEKCYINLALIDRRTAMEDKQQKMSFSLEARLRLDSSEVDQNISLENLFESRKLTDGKTVNPRRIFIQGRAGIGKTTLCKKIVYEFLEGRLGSTLFDRLLWIPVRGLKSNQDGYEWQELLRDTFKFANRTWKRVGEDYISQFESPKFLSRTLFLFDGLDEISYRWTKEEPLYRFLDAIMRDIPNIIITSRPQANTFSLDRFDLDLETVGFTVDQVSTYIKHCAKDPERAAKMEEVIANKPLIRGLLRIPIQVDAFCYTWNEDASDAFSTQNSITMTTLYSSIMIELCKKDLRLLGKLDQQQQPPSSEVEGLLRVELAVLEEIAFQGLLNSVAEFNPQHWDKLGNYFYKSSKEFSTILSTIDRLSFLRTSDHDSDCTKRTYHFIHLTFQEFFAARHITERWQHNKPLTHLRLTHRGKTCGESDSRTPLAFLQEEKYNPRYNIFWRFVAGLLSEKNDVVMFFQQLHAEPKDLLGAAHWRLLMYCLSEVLPSQNQQIRELHIREECLLQQWTIKEFKSTGQVILGREAEYPEDVLCAFLQTANDLPYRTILSVLEDRTFVSIQALRFVSKCINDQFPIEIRLQAIKVVFENSRSDSQEIVAQATQFFSTMLKDKDWNIRLSAMNPLNDRPFNLMEYRSPLPHQAITALITALKEDENPNVRGAAAQALRVPSSTEVISALVTALKEDENPDVRGAAAQALRVQSSIEVLTALITALKDENHKVRWYAADALAKQSSIKVITPLITALKEDENHHVRGHAAYALGTQSSLPAEAISALIRALEKDQDYNVRGHAADALEEQSSIKATTALIRALKDDEACYVRGHAACALGTQSSLPAEVITILIRALEDDEDSYVRAFAAYALQKQSSLPVEAITALITAVKDEDSSVRDCAVSALGAQSSLPAEAITTLITALKNKDCCGFDEYSFSLSYLLNPVAEAMKNQSSLSAETVADLITISEDQSHLAFDILCNYGLFYSAIKDLSGKAWQQLWSYWTGQSSYSDICCYELEGCLYTWSNGMLHQISTNPLQTQALLQVVLPAKQQPPRLTVVPDSFRASQSPCANQSSGASATAGPISRCLKRKAAILNQ